MIILKTNTQLAKLIAGDLTEEQIKEILLQGEKFSERELIKIIRLFIQAQSEIKNADFPQLPLELAIIEALNNFQNDFLAKSDIS